MSFDLLCFCLFDKDSSSPPSQGSRILREGLHLLWSTITQFFHFWRDGEGEEEGEEEEGVEGGGGGAWWGRRWERRRKK